MGNNTTSRLDSADYLVSISDLMSSLLFLFIMALVIFAIRLNAAAAQHQNQIKRLSDAREVRDSLLVQLERSLLDRGIQVRVDLDRGVLRIPEQILFASGRADLGAEGMGALEIVAGELDLVLCQYAYYSGESGHLQFDSTIMNRLEAIFIEGHTDNVPLMAGAAFADNWHLSTVRAINTFKAMLRSRDRLGRYINPNGQALFSVTGYADQRPVADNSEEIGRAQNRRIDLRFIMATPIAPHIGLDINR